MCGRAERALGWPPCSRARLLLSFGGSAQSMCYCWFATLTCAAIVITYKKLECKRELKICIFMLYSFIVFPAHSKPNMWMDTSVGLQIPTACRWQWIKFATANADWLIRPNLPIMQQSLVCSTCSSGLVTSPTRCRPSVVIMENT